MKKLLDYFSRKKTARKRADEFYNKFKDDPSVNQNFLKYRVFMMKKYGHKKLDK